MTLDSGTKLGRYEIRSKIGEGGMGEVYLAEDVELRRRVALKILSSDVAANPGRMRRFKHEAQAAAALNHPNIAHIYGSSVSCRGQSPIFVRTRLTICKESFADVWRRIRRNVTRRSKMLGSS